MDRSINVFSDSASLIFRAMLKDPSKKWTVPSFTEEGVSLGLASMVINQAESLGYIEHIRRVAGESYCRLLRKDLLLKDWVNFYSFERNPKNTYFYQGGDILKELNKFMKKKERKYALTLYSASRLISPYVKDERDFVYLDVDPRQAKVFFKELETRLTLQKALSGGNVCFAIPFYKCSIFRDSRIIKSFPVVSDLQLYLDLMGFPPVGRQEVEENLLPLWRKKGVSFV